MSPKRKKSISTRSLTQFSILLAIEIVLGFTPLGLIVVPGFVSITLLHIPVIITAIVFGWKQGALLGLSFGIISLVKATTAGVSVIDKLFSPFLSGNPIASFIMVLVPRILLGVFAAGIFALLKNIFKNNIWSIGITAGFSTALHTIMVLGCLFLFFDSISLRELFTTLISLNGILEILAAVIICTPVCKALLKYNSKHA